MKPVLAICRRELRSAFNSPVAYAVIIAFLLFQAIMLYFVFGFYAMGQADLRSYFGIIPFVFALLVPALSMRSWAEERRLGTYELLLTMPFTETQLVLGKFLGILSSLGLALALSLGVPLCASLMGSFDAGVLLSQYLGTVLLAAAAAAVGEWVSSLAKNQVSAFIAAAGLLFGLVLVNNVTAYFRAGGVLASLLNWVSLSYHYQSFSRGVVDSRDLLYFVIVCAAFLYLSTWNLARRKWR